MAETSGRRGDYTQDVSSHNIYMEMRSAPGTLFCLSLTFDIRCSLLRHNSRVLTHSSASPHPGHILSEAHGRGEASPEVFGHETVYQGIQTTERDKIIGKYSKLDLKETWFI